MLNTLTDTHGGRMLSALRQQIEESRLQSLYGCFGVGTARELFRKVKEAQEAATQARKHSILNLGSAFPSHPEMMRRRRLHRAEGLFRFDIERVESNRRAGD